MPRSSVVAFLVVLVEASVIAALVVSLQDAGREKAVPVPPQDELAQRRNDFVERIGEAAGIIDSKGTSMTVSQKFHTLDAGQKEVALNMLAAHVFQLSEDGSLQPDQVLDSSMRRGEAASGIG